MLGQENLGFYLPLTRSAAVELSSLADTEIATWAKTAAKDSLVCTLFILGAGRSGSLPDAMALERSLSRLVGSITTPAELVAVRKALCEQWNQAQFKLGLTKIAAAGGVLLDDDTLPGFEGIRPGRWLDHRHDAISSAKSPLRDRVASADQEFLFSDQQGRIFRQIISEQDESFDLQGYAGVGKTHLARAVVQTLNRRETLLLALTRTQLQALQRRLDAKDVPAMTFGELAAGVLKRHSAGKGIADSARSHPNYQMSDRDIADLLNLSSVANLNPVQVSAIARRAVMAFCSSRAVVIGPDHLPSLTDVRSREVKLQLIAAAQLLWNEITNPTPGQPRQLPLRRYHQIKLMSLLKLSVPSRFRHVIIDEAHDLSAAMMVILDHSAQRVITLGDRYQRLSGFVPPRHTALRHRELTQTLRSGNEVAAVFNPIIQAHPVACGEPLEGRGDRETLLRYYDRLSIPEQPTTILTGTDFHLFEWFQRLSHAGAKFALLGVPLSAFESFVSGLVQLYHDGKRSTHPYLFRYPTWDSLANAHAKNAAFSRIEDMLAKGYGVRHFKEGLSAMAPVDKAALWLARVEDVRNQEFDSVTLGPELLSRVDVNSSDEVKAGVLAQLYTAASRVKYELHLPGYLKDWIDDLSISG